MGSSTGNSCDGVVVQEEGESSNVNPNVLPPMVGGNPNKKTLVLDLDGTLVHSGWTPTAAGYDFMITLKGYEEPIYVLKRPGVDELLQQLGSTGLYEIVMVGGNPNKKTLVLDLDGTLVHSGWTPTAAGYDFMITLKGYEEPIYVLKRPGVDELLQQLGSTGLYEIVIFTAGRQCYADAVVDKILDSLPPSPSEQYNNNNRNIIPATHRLGSHHCSTVEFEGVPHAVKDLAILGRNLKNVIIVDDRPTSFHLQPQNGIQIDCWTGHDAHNTSLFQILSFCLTIQDPKSPYSTSQDVRELIKHHYHYHY